MMAVREVDAQALSIARAATLVVAASTASTLSKAQADYICDGTDDQVQIQAAIDAVYNSGAGMGTVLLTESPTRFQVNGDITIPPGVTLKGLGPKVSAIGLLGTTDSVILVGSSSASINEPKARLQDLDVIGLNESYAGNAVLIELEDKNVNTAFDLISNVQTGSANAGNGVGFYFHVTATSVHSYISRCHFGPMFAAGFAIGLKIYLDGTDSEAVHAWASGLTFEYFQSLDCTKAIEMDAASAAYNHMSINAFRDVLMQGSDPGIDLLSAACKGNGFWMHCDGFSGDDLFTVAANCTDNFFLAYSAGNFDYVDLGTRTKILASGLNHQEITGFVKPKVNIASDTHYDALDVSGGVDVIQATTSSVVITIGGLANGVDGQVVHIYKTSSAFNLVIEFNEGGATQPIITTSGLDTTIADYGGITLACSGTTWYEVGH